MWMILPEIVMQNRHYGRAYRSHRWGAEADRQTLGLSPCETTGSSPVATTKAEPNRKVRLVAYSFG